MTTPEDYRFDDRTLQTLLTQFREYSALIPFSGTGKNWDEFFFNDGQSVESLVDLLQDAENAQGNTLPHQAYLLAFLRMLETPRRLINTLPYRHRELYFRGVLGTMPRAAEPDSILVQFVLDEEVDKLNLPAGLLLDGGQDSQGAPLQYRLADPLLINHARWSDLYWIAGTTVTAEKSVALSIADNITLPAKGVRLFSTLGNKENVSPGSSRVLSEEEERADVPADEELYELYMGFDGITPGQQLSLYWELDTPMPFKLGGIKWEYLAEVESTATWKTLTRQISDETGNFSRSGNGYVTLPEDATNQGLDDPSEPVPAGRYWLRASQFVREEIDTDLPEDTIGDKEQPQAEQFPWLTGLWTNATQVSLIDAPTIADDHFAMPLPAGTITRTVEPLAGLSAVNQPLPGTGGRAQEDDDAMMARMASRVAHRGRASTWRDISTLIIDNFPDVHHVRLPGVKILDGLYIPETPDAKLTRVSEEEEEEKLRVQEVMLVPRAGINEGNDPQKPIFTPAYLQKVKAFISDRASPWLNLRVLNPYYRTIKVAYKLHWKAGVNQENAAQQLEAAVLRHFMPWLVGDTMVTLGSSLTINDIILVMQQQPGVNWVEDLTLDDKHDAIDTTLVVMILELTQLPATATKKQRG